MSDNQTKKAIENTLNNTIHREIGCFVDEVIKAEYVFCLYDKTVGNSIWNFIDDLNAIPLNDKPIPETSELTSNALLIIVTKDGKQNKYNEIAELFKINGGRVIALTSNRRADFTEFTHELLGVNINQEDRNNDKNNQIFKEVTNILINEINERLLRLFKSTNEINYI